jgi:N-acetylmuramoyl-L-alanine amidase
MGRFVILLLILVSLLPAPAWSAGGSSESPVPASIEGGSIEAPVPAPTPIDEGSGHVITLLMDGRRFLLEVIQGERQEIIVPLDAAGLGSLFEATGASFKWYPYSRTVVVFGMGRDERWPIEAASSSCDGAAIPMDPGTVDQAGKGFIPLESLARLLKCRAFPVKPGVLLLKPSVYSIKASSENGFDRFTVRASHRVSFKALRSGNTLKLTIPGTGLCLPWAQALLGETTVRASGGSTPDDGAVLEFTFPRHWSGEAFRLFRSEEIVVALRPAFPVKIGWSRSRIDKIEWNCAQGEAALSLEGKGGFQYFWRRDESSGSFILEIPRVAIEEGIAVPPAPQVAPVRLRAYTAGKGIYPVTRFLFSCDKGISFQVTAVERSPSIVVSLRAGEESAAPGTSGEGATLCAPAGVLIVIDAGHGGSDPGACANGLREKDINLAVALRLKARLESLGLRVVMTRTADVDVKSSFKDAEGELWSRVKIANDCDADLFISLHCNASQTTRPSGTSIHWFKECDLALAQTMVGILGQNIGVGERGIIFNRFYVLRNTRMPAILVEMAFITNPHDAFILKDPASQDTIAERLSCGLFRFLTEYYAATPKESAR